MDYKLVRLEEVKLVGKTFEFPTSEIQTVNYQKFYGEVCKGMNPEISYGIYEVGDDVTKFTVAIKTQEPNDYQEVIFKADDFFEFEIDFMKNQEDNQYVKCFEQLAEDQKDVDMGYSVEVMDRNFNPMKGQFTYKYYLRNMKK